jgi:hypothetical protein
MKNQLTFAIYIQIGIGKRKEKGTQTRLPYCSANRPTPAQYITPARLHLAHVHGLPREFTSRRGHTGPTHQLLRVIRVRTSADARIRVGGLP